MKLTDYLHQSNITRKDIPKVLITFKAGAWLTWFITIPICARFQPLRRLFRLRGPKNIKDAFINRYPQRYASWEKHVINGSEYFARLRMIRWIPRSVGQKPKDFGLAVAESTVLYKCLFPIWAPLEFMLIVRLYQKHWTNTLQLPSLTEYSDSYQQTSAVNVYDLSSDEQDVGGRVGNENDVKIDSEVNAENNHSLSANNGRDDENKVLFAINNEWSNIWSSWKNERCVVGAYAFLDYSDIHSDNHLLNIIEKFFYWRQERCSSLEEYVRNEEIKKKVYEIMIYSSSSMYGSMFMNGVLRVYDEYCPDFREKKSVSFSVQNSCLNIAF